MRYFTRYFLPSTAGWEIAWPLLRLVAFSGGSSASCSVRVIWRPSPSLSAMSRGMAKSFRGGKPPGMPWHSLSGCSWPSLSLEWFVPCTGACSAMSDRTELLSELSFSGLPPISWGWPNAPSQVVWWDGSRWRDCRSATSRLGHWSGIGIVYVRLYRAHFNYHYHPRKYSSWSDPHRIVCRLALSSQRGCGEFHCARAALFGKRNHATRGCMVSQRCRGDDRTPGTLYYFDAIFRVLFVTAKKYLKGMASLWCALKRTGGIPWPDPSPSASLSLTESSRIFGMLVGKYRHRPHVFSTTDGGAAFSGWRTRGQPQTRRAPAEVEVDAQQAVINAQEELMLSSGPEPIASQPAASHFLKLTVVAGYAIF